MAAAPTTDPTATSACCAASVGTPLSEADASSVAQTYAALADPVRIRLLSLIAASGEICSCDLVAPLSKSQPTISHHTKVLADAGLIVGDKRGRWVHWRVEPSRVDFVRQALQG